jgi:hypothetical protein
VDDATWREFRRVIEDRSVAEVLGRYVNLEVARAQRDRVSGANLSERELAAALESARALTDALWRITQRLEARLPRHS